MSWHPALRRPSHLVAATLVAISTVAIGAGRVDAAADCSALTDPLYDRARPADDAQLVTAWPSEADGAARLFGFTDDRGQPYSASTSPAEGLTGVHRIYHPLTRDFAYLTSGAEIDHAEQLLGYIDQGTVFYAATEPAGCTVPVLRFLKGDQHRVALGAERAALEADGWRYEMIAFHAVPAGSVPPPPTTPPTTPTTPPTTAPPTTAPPTTVPPAGGSSFTFAVIPDTQNETYAGEVRMQERVEWLLDQRDELGLRWVLHSGDVHNWDTPTHDQFVNMSSWLQPLTNAGLPYVLTPGNHDTAAVCPGGSACPGQNANLALRDTTTWNRYYPPARFGLEGVFEAGKSDNGWRTFSAGGRQWLILSLELWPRTEVIDWARGVVGSHPHHNVIVVTHEFLDAGGRVSGSNGGYGANSPATLWNALDDYPNVVMTFSGHVGSAAEAQLTAVDGHKTAAFLQAYHDARYNPTRLVTVNTATGTITTRVVANYDRILGTNVNVEYTADAATISGMRFVT